MNKSEHPQIAAVDKIDNSVLVTFEDETTGIYPAALLEAAKGVGEAIYEKETKTKTKP